MAKNKHEKVLNMILEEVKKVPSITGYCIYNNDKDLTKVKALNLDSVKGIQLNVDTKGKASIVLNLQVSQNSSTKVIYNMLNLALVKKMKSMFKLDLTNFEINILNTSVKVK